MRRTVLALCCLTLASGVATSGEVSVTLEDARVRYDDTRWQAHQQRGRIGFAPAGERMRFLDPVEFRILEDSASCTDLALQAFEVGAYDTSELASTPIIVDGIAGERFEAHTGCRNATPRGVVICVKAAGRAYLLQSLNIGCEGRNLFSGIDPLVEIAEGISFTAE